MKILSRALLASGSLLLLAGIGFADTLELKDGRVLQGKYLGGTQAVLRFQVNGDVQTFPTNDILALTFIRAGGSATSGQPPMQSVDPGPERAGNSAPAPDVAPAPQQTAPPPRRAVSAPTNDSAGGDVTLPAG